MSRGSLIGQVFTWLNDPSHWRGSRLLDPGITAQLLTHLRYSLIAVGLALLVALPLGLTLGHAGRGGWLVSTVNALRAVPTVGLLFLLTVAIAPHFHGRTDVGYVIPTLIVLVLLAIPPILANTHAGVQNVDAAAVDGARGMGMTGRQVLLQVELPNALPLIFSGVRSAMLQVIATATVAASVTLGGLGRFIYDGLSQQDYPQMLGGAVLVAALAVIADLVLALVQRVSVSRGVSGRFRRRRVVDSAIASDPREAALTDS